MKVFYFLIYEDYLPFFNVLMIARRLGLTGTVPVSRIYPSVLADHLFCPG